MHFKRGLSLSWAQTLEVTSQAAEPGPEPGSTATSFLPILLEPELDPSRNTQVVLHLSTDSGNLTEVCHQIVQLT